MSWRLRGLTAVLCGLLGLVPTGLDAATARWNPSEGATGYKLYYGLVSQDYDTVLDTGPATSAVVSGLAEGATYYFAATAYNSVGESDFSEEVPYTVPVPPPDAPPSVAITSPTNGATVPRGQTITIRASASDDSGQIARVRIVAARRRSDGTLRILRDCLDTTSPYQCSWQVPSTYGVKYRLTAKAWDPAGHSTLSAVVEVTAR